MGFLNKFRVQNKKQTLEEEVFEHVYDLLSTKRYFGAMQQDFGLVDFADARKSTLLTDRIIEQIETTLKKYEPRIVVGNIEATEQANRLQLSFVLNCTIQNTKHSLLLSFQNHKDLIKMEVDP